MAVEESIKIKIQANAEEFKIVSNIINAELGKLGKNFEILEGNIKQTSNAMKGFDNSSKKFNKGIMSISLILQDLPYGFRGIQNNIPALAQGFGVLYLAISAVTAAMTYFVLEGDNMSKGTKKLYETFKDFINGVVNDLVNALYPAFKSITESIKFLWNLFGENIIYQFKAIWENLLAFLKIGGAILANAFEAVTSLIKGDWAKFGESLLNIFKLAWNGIIQFLSFALKQVGNGVGGFVKIFNKDLGTTILKSVDYTANEFANKFKFAFKEVENASKKIDVFSLFGGKKKGGKGTEKDKPTVSKVYENLAQEEFNFYKDSIFRAEEYYVKLNNIQKNNALMEATIRGASVDELFAIQQTYEQKLLNFRKSIEDKKIAIRQQSEERQNELTKANNDKKLKAEKELLDRSIYFTEERIKAINLETDSSLKANRKNYQAQKANIEEAIAKLVILRASGIGGAEGMMKVNEQLTAMMAKLEGLVDPLEQFETNFNSTINSIATGALVELGTQLGNVFSGAGFSMDGFLSLLANALIQLGTYLVTISELFITIKALFASGGALAPFAIPIGLAAIAAGVALNATLSKKNSATPFANGGIISGPTLGLMGEYPGAANNPEVVAPLDKLQSLIGGSGGTLEARISGNDLLILMNKAGRNNNNTF